MGSFSPESGIVILVADVVGKGSNRSPRQNGGIKGNVNWAIASRHNANRLGEQSSVYKHDCEKNGQAKSRTTSRRGNTRGRKGGMRGNAKRRSVAGPGGRQNV